MKMNRIKWNENMYYRCISRVHHILNEDKKNQSYCSENIKNNTDSVALKNISDNSNNVDNLSRENISPTNDYPDSNTISEKKLNKDSANFKNSTYRIGIGKCIECEIVPDYIPLSFFE